MSIAISLKTFGPPEVLKSIQYRVTPPAPQEVTVRQVTIGVDYTDVYLRTGQLGFSTPVTPGFEAAGYITSIGDGVFGLARGDRVAYVSLKPGSYCEERTLPANQVLKLPASIQYDIASASLLRGLSVAYLFNDIFKRWSIRRGDYILWHAGAGGLGLIACQWAKYLGYRLIVTASTTEKCKLAIKNGAYHTVNYKTTDFVHEVLRATDSKGVPIVVDPVGQATWQGSMQCLREFGLLVSFGTTSGLVSNFNPESLKHKSIYITRPSLFTYIKDRSTYETLATDYFNLLSNNIISIMISARYPLTNAAAAHRALESRMYSGSMIITT